MGDSDLTCLGNNCNSAAKFKLSLNDWEDPYLRYVMITEKYTNKTYEEKFYVVPEQQAHPIFLTNGTSFGEDDMIYYLVFKNQSETRYNSSIMIIDDLMYYMKQKDDSSWEVYKIFTKGVRKMLKQTLYIAKKSKELAKIDHDKAVNDYIAQQQPKLATVTYQKDHKAYLDRFEQERQQAKDIIAKGREWFNRQAMKTVTVKME